MTDLVRTTLLREAETAFVQGAFEQALGLFRRALQSLPREGLLHYNAALCCERLGRLDECLQHLDQGLGLLPLGQVRLPLYQARGLVRERCGDLAGAESDFRVVLESQGDNLRVLDRLGSMLRLQRRTHEALPVYQQATRLDPETYDFWIGLADAWRAAGNHPATLEALERAIALEPRQLEPRLARARLLEGRLGRLEDSLLELEVCTQLAPGNYEPWRELARGFAGRQQFEQARACAERALQLAPDEAELLSFQIVLADHDPDSDRVQRTALRTHYGERFGTPPARRQNWSNRRDPRGRLRVGYVSNDFYRHSAANIFVPVIERHNPHEFEVYCYSGTLSCDDMTERARRASHVFAEVAYLGHEALAQRIEADAIDVLVDLSGHTAANRLPVFALKPAPVQITAWGYANGTGLDSMDYLLADSVTVPEEHAPLFTEQLLRISTVIACEPPLEAPAVAPLPMLAQGSPTFGCLNRFDKVSEQTLRLWATLLGICPEARLLLKDVAFEVDSTRSAVLQRLANLGVNPERVVLLGRTSRFEHLAAYAQVDIALDPFPSGGGVTTLEALWMGVPTIACLGDSPNSRVAGALMSLAGLGDFVTTNHEDYAVRAFQWSTRIDALQALRSGLRVSLGSSPLFDMGAYVREVERAYRGVWRAWCESGAS